MADIKNKRHANDRFIYQLRRVLLKLMGRDKIIFGSNLRILGAMPIFKIPQNGRVILGDNVVLNSDFIGSNTSLTAKVKFVTGYNGKIIVGNNCDLNGTCFVSYNKLEIGDHCQFGSSSIISDTDFHPVDPKIRLSQMRGESFPHESVGKGKIKIGNNVWVGWGAIILKGVTIGDNSVIAAGAVVVSDVPANCVAAGNPARVVKNI